jgi:SOS-response transcriptional repressor LexA
VLLLRTIVALTDAEGGRPPTINEIRQALGMNSTQPVHERICHLEAAGWIERRTRQARSLRVLHREELPPAELDVDAMTGALHDLVAWMEAENGPLHEAWETERIPAPTWAEALAWAREPLHVTPLRAVRLYRQARRSLCLVPAAEGAGQ